MSKTKTKKADSKKKAESASIKPHSDVVIPNAGAALEKIDALSQYNENGFHWICFCGEPSCGIGPFTRRVKGKPKSERAAELNLKAAKDCGCGNNWGPMDSHGNPITSRREFEINNNGNSDDWSDDWK